MISGKKWQIEKNGKASPPSAAAVGAIPHCTFPHHPPLLQDPDENEEPFFNLVLFRPFPFVKSYFKDPWNTFDFITVVGSIVDALAVEFAV